MTHLDGTGVTTGATQKFRMSQGKMRSLLTVVGCVGWLGRVSLRLHAWSYVSAIWLIVTK